MQPTVQHGYIMICNVVFSNMFLAENEENSVHDNQNKLYFLYSGGRPGAQAPFSPPPYITFYGSLFAHGGRVAFLISYSLW